jgi:DNA modification methylase
MSEWRIIEGDCREVLATLPAASVQCCVTSPPYWNLRDYGVDGQIGLEATVQEYVGVMVAVFREVRRVLRDDGTCWVNLGDAYAGGGKGGGGSYESERPGWELTPGKRMERGAGRWGGGDTRVPFLKPKDLIGLPWRVAFALQEDGWWLRSDIVWHKPNPMPESVTDRPTRSHEFIFLLTKSARYFFDGDAIREPASGIRAVGPNSGVNVDRVPVSRKKHQDAAMGGGGNGFKGHSGNRMADGTLLVDRNKRDVWTVATTPYAAAHFATFAPKLIEPCILAGTSEKGACPECGAPWRRVTERNNPSKEANTGADMTGGAAKTSNPQTSNGLHRNGGGVYSSAAFVGWEPSCECGRADTVPCVVLDPFAGAGTTGLVAARHDRNFIGIELSPQYAAMARKRIAGDAPLLQGAEAAG